MASLARMPTPSAPSARPALWTRLFTSLTVANFGIAMIFYMLTSTLSAWALDELDASQTEAGLVGTAWFIGAMAARLVAGRMSATLGERNVVVGSTLAMLLGTLVYPWVGSVALLLVLRFLHGVGFGIAATALTGTALSRVPIERRGEGSGWFSLGLALATGIGPFVGAQLQKGSGQQSVFLAAIVCGLVVIAVSRPAAGMLQDRVGDTTVLVPMMIAMVAGVLLTALATSGALLLAGGALLGLGYGPMGYRGALLVGAGCAVAGTLMMGVLHHRMRRRPRERVA